MSDIRIGIIGAGYIASKHLEVIDQIKDIGIDIRIFESPKSFNDIILLITKISKLLGKEKEAKKPEMNREHKEDRGAEGKKGKGKGKAPYSVVVVVVDRLRFFWDIFWPFLEINDE